MTRYGLRSGASNINHREKYIVHGLTTAEKLDDHCIEIHPELSFAKLLGKKLDASKRTPEGFSLRRKILVLYGVTGLGDITLKPHGDDYLDVTVAALTAYYVDEGKYGYLGDDDKPIFYPLVSRST